MASARPKARSAARPGGRAAQVAAGPTRLALTGLAAALWAAALGLAAVVVVVLAVWAADSHSGTNAATTTRTALQLWLLCHHGVLGLPHGSLGLTPLGLAALPVALLVRAGAGAALHAGATGWRGAGRVAVCVAAPYSIACGALASLAGTPQVRPGVASALLFGGGVALLAAGGGAVRANGGLRRTSLPDWLRRPALGGAAATAALVAGGAAVALGALVAHAGTVADLTRALPTGTVGGVALALLTLGLVPNAVVAGSSYLAGPGFAVGLGTSVSPFATHLGAVPALPLLGALPAGSPPAWAGLLLGVPLLAGLLAGWVVVRGATGAARRLAETAGGGVLAGAALALLGWLAGGPAGPGRLTAVGPSPWRLGLVVAAEVGLAAMATAAVATWRERRA